ncbi:helix-turn-helix domain-containing protein [Belliella pelovolcani]|uniref:helix-turn-helix domain-containing protein n=1 Tax=Belliella pelovolcani TaxID=529505 RepID=UPI00391DF085
MKTDIIHSRREKVAEILLSARVQKGLTQEQLGEKVGFAQNTIARIENCRFSPNADQLYALCEALDLNIKINETKI